MIKCQVCKCLVKNCECPGTTHLCMTCGGSKTDNSCNCCSICSGSQETCNCCKVCGKQVDFCQGCCNTCKQVQGECVCPQCQQLQCSCCMTCQQPITSCLCCPECHQPLCVCCKNCRKPDCGACFTRCLQKKTSCDCCQRCQATKTNCNCPPKVQVLAKTPQSQASTIMSNLEPPDICILKDRTQLKSYISALE